jgi:hypothetical protein
VHPVLNERIGERTDARRIAPASVDDLIAQARDTYVGPLEIGEDLMSFEIGQTVRVRRWNSLATKSRSTFGAMSGFGTSLPFERGSVFGSFRRIICRSLTAADR